MVTLSVLNILAISGTSGSSGFGSHRREQMDNNTANKKERKISIVLLDFLLYRKIASQKIAF